jgi:opacity protein-like surface antigen
MRLRIRFPQEYFFLALLCTIISAYSVAQVASSTKGGGGKIGIFGEFTAGKPNFGSDFLYGPTIGGYIQLHRWLGGEARGSLLKWGPSAFHQDMAVVGPRFQYPFHRFVPYGSFDMGVAHVTYPNQTTGVLDSSNKLAWEMASGVDYRLNHRIDLRLFDFTYGKIYVLQHGLNPKGFSSGIVFRLF